MSIAAKVTDDATSHSSHIFHSPDEALTVLKRRKAALESFADYLDVRTGLFFDPTVEAFHLWHQMPPPSYEYACGLRLPSDATYRTPFPIASNGMVVLRLGAGARTEVRFGSLSLIVLRREDDDGAHFVKFGEDRVQVPGKYVQLTVRLHDGKTWIGANGVLVGSISGELPAEPAVIRTKRKNCHLIAAHTLDGEGRFLAFEQSAKGVDEFDDERNPFRFEWGLRTCAMLNIFIALAVARDLTTAARDADVDPDARPVLARIRAAADKLGPLRYVFDSLAKWPHWRPCVGLYPENGLWDRNSFSNGTMPGLFALLARLYGHAGEKRVIEKFHDRGTSFIGTKVRASFLQFPARDENVWIKRSANHGLIMLTAYMLGAKLLDQTERDDVKDVDRALGEAMHQLHQDGSFCEGVAYEFFGMSYLIPYVKLFGRDHAYDETKSVSSLLKLLGMTYDWISLSHTASGDVFANFGDNFTRRVRRTSYLAFVQSCSDRRVDAPAGYKKSDELFSLTPDLDRSPRSGPGLETRAYPINQTYLAAAFGDDGRRRMGLFVIGSTMQVTHNHNHDCGGFAFYWGQDGVAIPRPKRDAHLNNAVGVMRGGQIEPHKGKRNYSGEVSERHASDSEARATSRVEFGPTFGDGQPLAWLERDFRLRLRDEVPLTVHTRLQAAADVTPFLAFHASGFSFAPCDGKWLRSFARRPDGGWEALAADVKEDQVFFLAPKWALGNREQEFLTCFGRGDVADAALIESCLDPAP